ncbi:MAG: hypothetical protein QOC89_24, partial [Paraburkholderia sp.]|nr:hypothetical protein [Paraburkholderia sp.]
MVRCMSAAGDKDMTAIEVSLLHHVSHRERRKKLADICFVLNIEDTHVATYALKKLVARGYVKSEKTGKEVFFSATDAGRALCLKYREVRESCLISTLKESGLTNEQIGEAAQLMRNASGLYDTAARAAASLKRVDAGCSGTTRPQLSRSRNHSCNRVLPRAATTDAAAVPATLTERPIAYCAARG